MQGAARIGQLRLTLPAKGGRPQRSSHYQQVNNPTRLTQRTRKWQVGCFKATNSGRKRRCQDPLMSRVDALAFRRSRPLSSTLVNSAEEDSLDSLDESDNADLTDDNYSESTWSDFNGDS